MHEDEKRRGKQRSGTLQLCSHSTIMTAHQQRRNERMHSTILDTICMAWPQEKLGTMRHRVETCVWQRTRTYLNSDTSSRSVSAAAATAASARPPSAAASASLAAASAAASSGLASLSGRSTCPGAAPATAQNKAICHAAAEQHQMAAGGSLCTHLMVVSPVVGKDACRRKHNPPQGTPGDSHSTRAGQGHLKLLSLRP